MGLYGMLVVTTAPTSTTTANTGTAYPGVSYTAEVPLLMSEIDPVQNAAVQAAVSTAGFSETNVWAGFTGANNQTALCRTAGGAAAPNGTCYPPAVNYTPLYYLFNGVAFDKSNSAASVFAATPTGSAATPVTGDVLVRFVNAGLRMHVPSIVGSLTGTTAVSGFSLIAEDGNPLPGTPRVQSEVFLAAGKTYDVMINTPASGTTALPVYDRELSLSGNATARDAGMLAYIGINGAGLPTTGVFSAAATAIAAPAHLEYLLLPRRPDAGCDRPRPGRAARRPECQGRNPGNGQPCRRRRSPELQQQWNFQLCRAKRVLRWHVYVSDQRQRECDGGGQRMRRHQSSPRLRARRRAGGQRRDLHQHGLRALRQRPARSAGQRQERGRRAADGGGCGYRKSWHNVERGRFVHRRPCDQQLGGLAPPVHRSERSVRLSASWPRTRRAPPAMRRRQR